MGVWSSKNGVDILPVLVSLMENHIVCIKFSELNTFHKLCHSSYVFCKMCTTMIFREGLSLCVFSVFMFRCLCSCVTLRYSN